MAKASVTVTPEVRKRLNIMRIEGDYKSVDDVIRELLRKKEVS